MADLDPENLHKLRVADLKDILTKKGISTTGLKLKADLVKRLREAIIDESAKSEIERSFVDDDDEAETFSYEPSGGNLAQFGDAMAGQSVEKSWNAPGVPEGFPSESPQLIKPIERSEWPAESELKFEDAERKLAEEHQRRMAEERQRRLADEEEERQRLADEEERKRRLADEEERQRRLADEEERRRLADEEERRRLADEEERRRLADEEEERQRRLADEEERQRRLADEEERQRLADEEKRRTELEEQERLLAEEREQQRILDEQKRHAEEKRKEEERKFQLEQQKLREEEMRKQAEVALQQKMLAEKEKIRLAEEQQRLLVEEQQRLMAEEQHRLMAEEQQRLMAEEQQRRMAEEQQRRMAEEQQRRMAEEQQRRMAEEQQRRMAEEQQRRMAEEQQRLIIEEQQRLMAEEQQRLMAEEQRRLMAEEQQKRLMAEEQQKILMAEEQQKRLMAEEQQKRLMAEEQQKRLIAEEQQKRLMAEEQQKRLMAEEQQKRLMAEEQQKRLMAEEQQKRLMAEEQKRLMAEEQRRLLAEEQQRLLAEEQQRLLVEQQQKLLAEQKQIAEEQQKIFSEPPPTMLVSALAARAPPMRPPSNSSMYTSSISHQIAPPGIHPPSMPMQRFTQPPPTPTSSIITTSASNAFPPPPPPPPIQSNQSATKEQNDTVEKKVEASGEKSVSATKDSDQPEEIKLPHAVEKILALKNERAQQLGVDPDSVVEPEIESKEKETAKKTVSRALVSVEEMEDEDMEEEEMSSKVKETKSRRRKKKKKKQKRPIIFDKTKDNLDEKHDSSSKENADVDIEYIQDVLDPADPLYSQFVRIFEKFKLHDPEKDKADGDVSMEEAKQEPKVVDRKKPMDMDDDDDDDDDQDDDKKDDDKPKLSKRKLKKLSRMTVAELKQKVSRPELVEMHDVTAKDPVLLLHLKASRNTVPVPRHWCFKRKYLQGKRGIEKPAFELPDFIKRTGIMEMRQALQEKEDQKTMKAKMRERVRPKLGKIDIDYQKLHDAFFKWQTKPKMTIHGDLYYEGKEFETRLKEKKPGDLNDDLRIALGMPTGPNANKCPPPWLIAMQRYGPPPSYPNLKIPGLNAPIPDACSFGYHAGGWGKPPVDEMGRPLYGDVFGSQNADNQPHIPDEEIDHTLWGELESESSEEEEDEEDEDEEEEKGEDETGLVTPAEGLITPSGFSSIPAGMETPDMIELRKRKIEAEMEGGETPALYTILPEKKSERVGAAMMGSTHIYDLAAAIPAAKVKVPGTASVPPQGIEVALDPSELEMDTAAMAARYEQTMREQQSQLEKEDLSDMVAEHAARQKTKRKKQQQDSGKPPKKYKEFKF